MTELNPQMVFTVLLTLLNLALGWGIYKANRAQDDKDNRVKSLEEGLNSLRLQVAAQHVRPELEQLREQVKLLSAEFHALAGSVNRLIGRLDGK